MNISVGEKKYELVAAFSLNGKSFVTLTNFEAYNEDAVITYTGEVEGTLLKAVTPEDWDMLKFEIKKMIESAPSSKVELNSNSFEAPEGLKQLVIKKSQIDAMMENYGKVTNEVAPMENNVDPVVDVAPGVDVAPVIEETSVMAPIAERNIEPSSVVNELPNVEPNEFISPFAVNMEQPIAPVMDETVEPMNYEQPMYNSSTPVTNDTTDNVMNFVNDDVVEEDSIEAISAEMNNLIASMNKLNERLNALSNTDSVGYGMSV